MKDGPPTISKKSGLIPAEQQVSDLLVATWNAFYAMDASITPEDMQRFRDGIHQCQQVFADRALRRAYPEYWQ